MNVCITVLDACTDFFRNPLGSWARQTAQRRLRAQPGAAVLHLLSPHYGFNCACSPPIWVTCGSESVPPTVYPPANVAPACVSFRLSFRSIEVVPVNL